MEAIVRVKERYVVCDVIYNNKSKANACPNEITTFFSNTRLGSLSPIGN